MAKTASLGVTWHLPNPRTGAYYTRPFNSTTQASADLIGMLADDGLTWAQMVDEILYDPEARAVAEGFVDAGHGDRVAAEFVDLGRVP